MIDYYSALSILSYNGILHFINSNRTLGKTWAFKIRAFKRGLKYGKKTIWVRRFKEEAKECAESFYTSKNLQKACGIIPFDSETNIGNFKQVGKTMFVKRRNKWVWFCKVVYLSKSNAMRTTLTLIQLFSTSTRQHPNVINVTVVMKSPILSTYFSPQSENMLLKSSCLEIMNT